jgi:S1-C subfamily serine protease
MARRSLVQVLALVGLVLALVACAQEDDSAARTVRPAETAGATVPAPGPAAAPQTAAPSTAPVALQPGGLPNIGAVVTRARPAVVGIAASAQIIDPFFRLIPTVQSGTGVIIDPGGYILTNNHVIENTTRIEVTLDNDETYVAEVIGRDTNSDLAVIKITAPAPLPYLPFAEPTSYRIGDWVVAIGNPLALPGGPTVTVGVIGALERTIVVDSDSLSDLVQTDAAINEGNSGGPLLDLQGDIVGINAIVASQGQAQGIGFAVSSFTASAIAKALIANGRVPWAWMGVSVAELSPSKALELRLNVRKGIIVTGVSRGGPANQAGILLGDVLKTINGSVLNRVRDLDTLLRETYKAGDTVDVTLLRGKEERTVKVTFTTSPRR